MHTEYHKPCPLSRQPTQPADDPSWSKPKPKFGQPTPIPPRNEACLCTQANIQAYIWDSIDIASVTPLAVNALANVHYPSQPCTILQGGARQIAVPLTSSIRPKKMKCKRGWVWMCRIMQWQRWIHVIFNSCLENELHVEELQVAH